jgi:hypothetical protein
VIFRIIKPENSINQFSLMSKMHLYLPHLSPLHGLHRHRQRLCGARNLRGIGPCDKVGLSLKYGNVFWYSFLAV